MTRNEFDALQAIFNEIDTLHNVLEGIDSLGPVNVIEFHGKDDSKKLGVSEHLGEEMNNLIRNKIRVMIKQFEIQTKNIQICFPSIIHSIEVNHFQAMVNKGWDYTYWFFDLHGTILKPSYKKGEICKTYYPHSKEVLQTLTEMKEVKMVMYTCSYPKEIEEYVKFFKEDNIIFDYINENPEVKNTGYGFYERKPYMNVLFEDKAGFNPKTDWDFVKEYLKNKKEWA